YAKNYNFNEFELRKCYYQRFPSRERSHGHCTLTIEQNDILLAMILTFSANEHGITTRQVQTLVEQAFGDNVSPSWVTRWLQKHSLLLTKRKTKYLPAKRTHEDILDEVETFIDHVDRAKSKF